MQEKAKEPEIRFAGFTGAWEQRKLNEIADVYDGVHQTPKYTSSGVRFLSVENIATLESEKYISEADFIRDFKIFPQKGDILMTRIGDIGTAKVIKSDEKYAFYVSLALLKPKHINSDFLCNSIASKNFQKGLKARSLLTAIPLKINKEEMRVCNFLWAARSRLIDVGGDSVTK
jgi:type I restriction enzyme S subunit